MLKLYFFIWDIINSKKNKVKTQKSVPYTYLLIIWEVTSPHFISHSKQSFLQKTKHEPYKLKN